MENSKEKRTVQLYKYQTSKKLIETVSRLKAGYPAGDEDKSVSVHHPWSKIGINIVDYSNGVGDKSVFVSFNLNPEEVYFLKVRVEQMMLIATTSNAKAKFEFAESKVVAAQKNDDGTCFACKMSINRIPIAADGTERRQPWVISIENGSAKPQRTQQGGTMAEKGSFKANHAANITLSDKDMYCLCEESCSFLSTWNIVKGSALIKAVDKGEF